MCKKRQSIALRHAPAEDRAARRALIAARGKYYGTSGQTGGAAHLELRSNDALLGHEEDAATIVGSVIGADGDVRDQRRYPAGPSQESLELPMGPVGTLETRGFHGRRAASAATFGDDEVSSDRHVNSGAAAAIVAGDGQQHVRRPLLAGASGQPQGTLVAGTASSETRSASDGMDGELVGAFQGGGAAASAYPPCQPSHDLNGDAES